MTINKTDKPDELSSGATHADPLADTTEVTSQAVPTGVDRRTFMASAMGLATCFLASNKVYGKVFDVDEVETMEEAAIDEKFPKGKFFVIDVQF